jgi:hypothetical protein
MKLDMSDACSAAVRVRTVALHANNLWAGENSAPLLIFWRADAMSVNNRWAAG